MNPVCLRFGMLIVMHLNILACCILESAWQFLLHLNGCVSEQLVRDYLCSLLFPCLWFSGLVCVVCMTVLHFILFVVVVGGGGVFYFDL